MKRVKWTKWLAVGLVAVMVTACGEGTNKDDEGGQPDNNTSIVTFNGNEYGKIISPHTQRVWLDRNMGAAQVCTSFDDDACYGDYYQWGRSPDGHEDSLSGVTTEAPTDIANVGHDKFIKVNSDWAKAIDSDGKLRENQWAKTDGNSVCPVGYRVPTIGELKAELDISGANTKDRDDVFNSFLKIPTAGGRGASDAEFFNQANWGYMHAGNATDMTHGSGAGMMYFNDHEVQFSNGPRGAGLPVRCIEAK